MSGKAIATLAELEVLIERLEQVVTQTRGRLAGSMPEGSTRLVSLHDADARPIKKGRMGKPVEFGYLGQVVDNAEGIVLDHSLHLGNPADGPLLAPAIARIKALVGRAPRQATADRGYGEARDRRRALRTRSRNGGDPAQRTAEHDATGHRAHATFPPAHQVAHGF